MTRTYETHQQCVRFYVYDIFDHHFTLHNNHLYSFFLMYIGSLRVHQSYNGQTERKMVALHKTVKHQFDSHYFMIYHDNLVLHSVLFLFILLLSQLNIRNNFLCSHIA